MQFSFESTTTVMGNLLSRPSDELSSVERFVGGGEAGKR